MTALCEPLVQIRTGRLTRRMESPTKLQPTGEVGVLGLWLLPNNDMSLVWQAQELYANVGQDDPRGAEMDSSVTLWEELVRFPAGTLPTADEPCTYLSPVIVFVGIQYQCPEPYTKGTIFT